MVEKLYDKCVCCGYHSTITKQPIKIRQEDCVVSVCRKCIDKGKFDKEFTRQFVEVLEAKYVLKRKDK